jgi:hypothetical protein
MAEQWKQADSAMVSAREASAPTAMARITPA